MDEQDLGVFELVSGSRNLPIGCRVRLLVRPGELVLRAARTEEVVTLANIEARDQVRDDLELDRTSRLPRALTWPVSWTWTSVIFPRIKYRRVHYLSIEGPSIEGLLELRSSRAGRPAAVILRASRMTPQNRE